MGGRPVTVAVILVVLLALSVAWLIGNAVERWIARVANRGAAQGLDRSGAYAFGRLARYSIWIVGTVFALDLAGLNLSSFALVGGAIGVGIGFGLQNIVSNFICGIIVLLERSLKVGDFVDLQSGVRGHVREIALRYTRITTNDSVDVLVPNSEFVNGRVTNWTFDDSNRRVHVAFGVAYGSEKNLVKEAGLAAAARIEGVLPDGQNRRSEVWLVAFGANSLDFELVVWVDRKRLMSPARTAATLLWALEDELRSRGLEFPFPQRDLHVRSGVLDVRIQDTTAPETKDASATISGNVAQ
ncbi:MAG: mechanosensitive ion channel domain-containing protein [Steroidobacteraceae bacterium]